MTSEATLRGLKKEAAWDYENGFYWFSSKTRLNKMLAHYELYKSIVEIPGHIFELGVYKGASLVRLATFRDALENDYSRKLVGFDAFGEFPTEGLNLEDDLNFVENFERTGGPGLKENEVTSILETKGFENFELIKGNVFVTLPEYLKKHPETRIAFLHLDMDVKEPTDFALELLYDRVVPGGLVVFDDYNSVAGETISADEFSKKRNLRIEKLPFYSVPSFIRKPSC
ncbi:TylF/MycF/NovP-related O-methyltransferase [Roseibium litorale]|uniref:Class I SAM-dependent methyltransferase n=1 Tax=Roseibium litorale TaxID=2803841 RepID=A0ABR9CPN5_9HYPH|nr:TylF/MycF/NovP-related O-methyltransferase [Roseibium litorale]MBD8892823.1 class I SAM-dependent methyltransferase [Roseibium litorale]